MQDQSLAPSENAILSHLRALFSNTDYDDGRIEIAYANEEGKLNSAETFLVTELEKAAAFAVKKNSLGVSVYLSGAILDPETDFFGRSSDKDFYAAPFLWADIDADVNEEWLKKAYEICKPSFAVVTARRPHRRIQLWWKLAEPSTDSDDVSEALQGICAALQGDPSVTNPTSLMRLGGGVNYPNKKKLAKGRVVENTEFHVLEERRYHIEEIKRAYPAKDYISKDAFNPPPQAPANDAGGLNIGHDIKTDGRERFASRMIYAAIVHLAEESGAWPAQQQVFDDVWPVYSRGVKSLAPGGLENEARGQKMIREKIKNKLALFHAGRMRGVTGPEALHAAWKQRQGNAPPPGMDPETGEIPFLKATSINDLDLDNIPPRAFLYEKIIGRKYVTMIIAPPGAGKSIFTMQLAVSAATDTPWGPWKPSERKLNVWIYNNEEGEDELRRRLKAIMIHNDIEKNDFQGRFFIDSGENRPIVIAGMGKDGVAALPDFEALKAEVIARKIDILIIDPFAESHNLAENSNDEIKRVTGFFRRIAFECNCAVILVHHTKKYVADQAGEADAGRGGGAQIGVVRRLFSLMTMTKAEAEKLNVPPERRKWFVRWDDAKSNITAPVDGAAWFRLKSVPILNGSRLTAGDEIGLLEHVSIEEITAEFTGEMDARKQKIFNILYDTMAPQGLEQVLLKDIIFLLRSISGVPQTDRKLRDMVKNAIETQHPRRPFIANGEANYFTISKSDVAKNNAYIIYRRWGEV